MKKFLLTTATLILATALFTSCGNKQQPEADTTKQAVPADTTKQASPATEQPVAVDKKNFDSLVNSIDVASDEEISASQWATAVKKAGVLRVGGVLTSFLFSQLDETDGKVRGFDSGIFELLARYILGDASKYEVTQVTSSTREAVLQSAQVDVVVATYSITEKRKELISFAGPYYTSRQAVLVKAGNKDISGVNSLEGKRVATQSGSTGPAILAQFAPKAIVEEFKSDIEARTAVQQKRVDAYVTDYTLLLNAIVKNPNTFEIAGEPFGSEDNYGLGLPKDSDGVAFINAFLKKIIENGTREKLWIESLGKRTGIENAPAAPVIE